MLQWVEPAHPLYRYFIMGTASCKYSRHISYIQKNVETDGNWAFLYPNKFRPLGKNFTVSNRIIFTVVFCSPSKVVSANFNRLLEYKSHLWDAYCYVQRPLKQGRIVGISNKKQNIIYREKLGFQQNGFVLQDLKIKKFHWQQLKFFLCVEKWISVSVMVILHIQTIQTVFIRKAGNEKLNLPWISLAQ